MSQRLLELSPGTSDEPLTVVPIVLEASDFTFPTDPEDLFGRAGRYVLEIGFGNGDYLCRIAEEHPEWNIIGADTSPSSVVRAYRRVRRRRLSNVRVFAGDGRFIVRNVIPDGGLERVFVNFPDPWPRRRHQQRRLLTEEFFRLLHPRLSDQAFLSLTTDHAEYLSAAVRAAERTGLYREEERTPPSDRLSTRWARRWLNERRDIRHVLFRPEGRTTPSDERIRIDDMQHIVLKGHLDEVAGFEKTVVHVEGATIVIAEALRDVNGSALVFPTIIEEADLKQFVLIEAYPRGEDVVVGVKRFGRPLSTRGLNTAVRCVADYLASKGFERIEKAD